MRQFTLSFLHQDPWENPVLPLGTALSTTVKTVTCYPLLRDLPLSLNERRAKPLMNSANQNQRTNLIAEDLVHIPTWFDLRGCEVPQKLLCKIRYFPV